MCVSTCMCVSVSVRDLEVRMPTAILLFMPTTCV